MEGISAVGERRRRSEVALGEPMCLGIVVRFAFYLCMALIMNFNDDASAVRALQSYKLRKF